jgi:hypothetical protein
MNSLACLIAAQKARDSGFLKTSEALVVLYYHLRATEQRAEVVKPVAVLPIREAA